MALLTRWRGEQTVPQTCSVCYIGETGRTFGLRLDEHKNEVETTANVEHKSAITDMWRDITVIDSGGVKVVDRETDRWVRWIKEAIWIRKMEPLTETRGVTD